MCTYLRCGIIRNRKINAKNRAEQNRYVSVGELDVIVSLWLDDDFFKWDEKKFMWHSGLFSGSVVVVVVYKHEAVGLWSPFQMFMY